MHAGSLRIGAASGCNGSVDVQRSHASRLVTPLGAGTKAHLKTSDRIVASWFAVTGLIHLVIEGERALLLGGQLGGPAEAACPCMLRLPGAAEAGWRAATPCRIRRWQPPPQKAHGARAQLLACWPALLL